MPFQLSPVATRNSVKNAIPKLRKWACLSSPTHGYFSEHSTHVDKTLPNSQVNGEFHWPNDMHARNKIDDINLTLQIKAGTDTGFSGGSISMSQSYEHATEKERASLWRI